LNPSRRTRAPDALARRFAQPGVLEARLAHGAAEHLRRLKTSLTLALIGALVAEFVTAKDGLGTLITTFSFELKVYLVFAVIIVVSLLGLVMYGLMEYLERKIVFWRRSRFTG